MSELAEELEVEDAELLDEAEPGEELEAVEESEEADRDEEEAEADDATVEEAEEGEGQPELVVTIEGEEPDEAPSDGGNLVNDLRRQLREAKKQLKEVQKAKQEPEAELGPRPKLEDFHFDDEKHAAALLEWGEKKARIDARKEAETKELEEVNARWAERFEQYSKAKAELGAKDFEDAEEYVKERLSNVHQSIIVDVAERPELVVYALGKNPKVAERLANIDVSKSWGLVRYTAELIRLENKMTVAKGKAKPAPEKRISGKVAVPKKGDEKLNDLRAKAERTGDWTEYFAAKRSAKK